MATVADRILDHLAEIPAGLDDGQLAAALGARRSTVNQVCRRLSEQGRLYRAPGPTGVIVNRVIRSAANGAADPTAGVAAAAEPAPAEPAAAEPAAGAVSAGAVSPVEPAAPAVAQTAGKAAAAEPVAAAAAAETAPPEPAAAETAPPEPAAAEPAAGAVSPVEPAAPAVAQSAGKAAAAEPVAAAEPAAGPPPADEDATAEPVAPSAASVPAADAADDGLDALVEQVSIPAARSQEPERAKLDVPPARSSPEDLAPPTGDRISPVPASAEEPTTPTDAVRPTPGAEVPDSDAAPAPPAARPDQADDVAGDGGNEASATGQAGAPPVRRRWWRRFRKG